MTAEQRRELVRDIADAERRRATGRERDRDMGQAELLGITRALYVLVGRDTANKIMQDGYRLYKDGEK